MYFFRTSGLLKTDRDHDSGTPPYDSRSIIWSRAGLLPRDCIISRCPGRLDVGQCDPGGGINVDRERVVGGLLIKYWDPQRRCIWA